jgi:hypothetical protein
MKNIVLHNFDENLQVKQFGIMSFIHLCMAHLPLVGKYQNYWVVLTVLPVS